MNQAQHQKLEFTQIPASHPPYFSPPPEREDSDRHVLQCFQRETHTQINNTVSHTRSKNLTALASHRNTQTIYCSILVVQIPVFLQQLHISTNMLAIFI